MYAGWASWRRAASCASCRSAGSTTTPREPRSLCRRARRRTAAGPLKRYISTLMTHLAIPELLAPAGSLDAVRAASRTAPTPSTSAPTRFNARDEGAQLTLDELAEACRIAHERGAPHLPHAQHPHQARRARRRARCSSARRSIAASTRRSCRTSGSFGSSSASIRELEIHGSTQMTVHDDVGRRGDATSSASNASCSRARTRSTTSARFTPPCRSSGSSRSCTARSASRTPASASCPA